MLESVTHRASFGADYRSGKDPNVTYQNAFTCFPSALPFRPKRTTPKPVVQGSQTAVVVGPKGEEIFTDKYGRVKVQFHWDREGKNDEDSSCWLRVGQLAAGRRWGASYWPRIGQEVIVDFLEGDPDQPIIVGTVYNADQMPPYLGQGPDPKHKNDNKVSGFKSNTTKGGQGFNELRFDDTKDKQQVFVHAEKDADIRVKNDRRENVLHDRHLTVGQEKDGKKEGDFRELVVRDHHTKVRRHEERQVGGNLKMLVGGDEGDGKVDLIVKDERKRLVEKDEHLTVGGARMVAVGGDENLTVGGSSKAAVSGDANLKVGGDLRVKSSGWTSLDVGGNLAVEVAEAASYRAKGAATIESFSTLFLSGKSITLSAGGGFIKIDSSGVKIEGTTVKINCGATPDTITIVAAQSPADPDGPKEPEEAKPAVPDTADDAKTGQKSN